MSKDFWLAIHRVMCEAAPWVCLAGALVNLSLDQWAHAAFWMAFGCWNLLLNLPKQHRIRIDLTSDKPVNVEVHADDPE